MKRALLGGTAVAMIAMFVPTAANAVSADTFTGPGCFFDTNANQTVDPQGNQDGVIGVFAVAQNGNTPDTTATIACWIDTPVVGAAGYQSQTLLDATHGDQPVTNNGGVITGARQISYNDGATHTNNVYLCESDNNGPATCTLATSAQIPPQAVIDALNTINDDLIAAEKQFLDPTVCLVTSTLYTVLGHDPTGQGVITFDPNGDVNIIDPLHLGYNPFYDCPPYDV